jgi:hypothetical protein
MRFGFQKALHLASHTREDAMRTIYATLIVLSTLSAGAMRGQASAKVSLDDVRALAGAWILDIGKSGLTEKDAERRVVTLGPTWLRMDLHRPAEAPATALIYNLDGTTNVNAYGSSTAVTKLTRDSEYVVLETVFSVNSQAVTLHERVPLIPGLDLPIQVMLRVEHGYQGVAPTGSKTSPNVSNVAKFFRKQP